MLRPEHSGRRSSTPQLLRNLWLCQLPGHQKQWYWLCKIAKPLSSVRTDFNYLIISVLINYWKCNSAHIVLVAQCKTTVHVFPLLMHCSYHSLPISHQYCLTFNISHTLVGNKCSDVILDLTSGFNKLGRDTCKMRQETLKCWDLMWLILEVLQYIVFPIFSIVALHQYHHHLLLPPGWGHQPVGAHPLWHRGHHRGVEGQKGPQGQGRVGRMEAQHSGEWKCDRLWHRYSYQAEIILCMRSANERRRYFVTSSLIGWAHTQNDSWSRVGIWTSGQDEISIGMSAKCVICLCV